MSTADKIAIVTPALLTLTSLAVLIAFAVIATAQQPQPLPHVALPEILPVAVRTLPEQRLTAPVQFFVPKRHADTVYNALLADIQAHDGLVIEHSAHSRSVQALVQEGYLERLSPLSTPSDGWFHQAYLDWFHNTVPLGATPQVQHTEGGPTTELTVYVRSRFGPSNLAVDGIAGSLFATVIFGFATFIIGIALWTLKTTGPSTPEPAV